MSAALVRQSLALVDPDFDKSQGKQKSKKIKKVGDLIPENQKIFRKLNRKGNKVEKVNLLQGNRKLSIEEARKTHKSKEQILQENLKKLELIKQISTVELDKNITKQIIERAVTRRPIKAVPQKKKSEKTAFTEEDFKKFEEEYFDDDI